MYISTSYRMGASAIWRIFFEFKISVILNIYINIGKILNEKNMPYCTSTHAITCLLLTQKLQCILPFYQSWTFEKKMWKVNKAMQWFLNLKHSWEAFYFYFLLQRCLKAYFLITILGFFIVAWMSKSIIHTTVLCPRQSAF